MRRGRSAAVWIAVSVSLLGSTGCRMVGPDYRGPPPAAIVNAPAAQGPFIGASGAEFAQEPAPNPWWHLYDSTLLDQLVAEAMATNADLRAAQANLERSAALLDEARAQRQPSASVNFDPSYQQLSAEGYLHSGTLAPTGLYDTGLSVSYEVDFFGRLRRVIEAAKADGEAVKAAYDLTRITVAAQTAHAYAVVCNTGEQLAVARRSLQVQLRSAEVTRRLLEAGRASILDFTRSSGLAAHSRRAFRHSRRSAVTRSTASRR